MKVYRVEKATKRNLWMARLLTVDDWKMIFFQRAKIPKLWQNEIETLGLKSSETLKRPRAFKWSRNGKRTIIWDTKLVITLTLGRKCPYLCKTQFFDTTPSCKFLPLVALLAEVLIINYVIQLVTPKVLV